VVTVSGLVLIWRLSAEARGRLDEEAVGRVERRAEWLVGVAFLLLAAYVGFEAVRSLVGQEAPDASPVGIALTALSIAAMLWLARAKRRVGGHPASRPFADSGRPTPWYLSLVTLAAPRSTPFGWRWPTRSPPWASSCSWCEKRQALRARTMTPSRVVG
jgi:hypothetical protein